MNYFKMLSSVTSRDLRDHRGENGVYVPKGRNLFIYDQLYHVVKEEIHCPTEQREEQQTTEPNRSINNKKRSYNQSRPVITIVNDNGGTTKHRKYSRIHFQLSGLLKVYHGDRDRYNGLTCDNYDRKLSIFNERCEKSGISDDGRQKALSIRLCVPDLLYYLDVLKPKGLELEGLSNSMKKRFQTAGRTRALLREWEGISLRAIMETNSDKDPGQCLELLIKRLSDIEVSLRGAYQNDTIMRDKLLNSVRDVES